MPSAMSHRLDPQQLLNHKVGHKQGNEQHSLDAIKTIHQAQIAEAREARLRHLPSEKPKMKVSKIRAKLFWGTATQQIPR